MKKLLSVLLVLNILLLTGCGKKSKFHELEPYVYEVDEYTSLDYDFSSKFYAKDYDDWSGGCSAITKVVNGHRLVGRNMDLNITNKCAYIVRTNTGKYKTIGLAYTFRDCSPDYNDMVKNGVSDDFYKILPFTCDDVMNEAGLYIEINMRYAEFWPNGTDKYSCSGTNPESSTRVYLLEIPRYVAENCATVAEAKEYISTLDIYSKNEYWNFSFLISDDKGQASLLEVAKNEVFWTDEDKLDTYDWLNKYRTKALCQTNFYLNEECHSTQDIKSGEGRFKALQNGINKVTSRSDMFDLMKRVQYSNLYRDYTECKNKCFDPRSEIIGLSPEATYDFVMSRENEDTIKNILNEISDTYISMTRQERQDNGEFWESTFTEVVDLTTKEIFVRFFENDNSLYLVGLDSTEKYDSISNWK